MKLIKQLWKLSTQRLSWGAKLAATACAVIVVLGCAYVGRPVLSAYSDTACGAQRGNTGNSNLAYAPLADAEMWTRIDEKASEWISRTPSPYHAWCAAKRDRLAQNIILKAHTEIEADRNTEHFLFARHLVYQDGYSWQKVLFYPVALVAVPLYSAVKIGDHGSPPTWSEVTAGYRGAWDALWL